MAHLDPFHIYLWNIVLFSCRFKCDILLHLLGITDLTFSVWCFHLNWKVTKKCLRTIIRLFFNNKLFTYILYCVVKVNSANISTRCFLLVSWYSKQLQFVSFMYSILFNSIVSTSKLFSTLFWIWKYYNHNPLTTNCVLYRFKIVLAENYHKFC